MTCQSCYGEVIFATTIMGLPVVLDAKPNPAGSYIAGADRRAHMVPPTTPGIRFASHYAACRAAVERAQLKSERGWPKGRRT